MKELLKQSLQDTPDFTVFCSSDVGDIEGGKKWFDQIMQHLKKANVCVSLMTPQSVYSSPWVAYESGGAYLRFEVNPTRSRLFPVCAYGMTASILPSPFNELQVRHLTDKAEIHSLCRELAGCLGSKRPKLPRKAIQEVVDEASKGSPHWAHVNQALVGHRQESSPFSLDNMLTQASTDVFCAGFNLHHLATTPQLKRALFDFLAKSPARTVRLLLSDPDKRHLIAGWKVVGDYFLKDLQDSMRRFRGWLTDAKKEKLEGTLEIRRASFITITVTCIDPESSNGQLVLVPTIPGKPLSADRPHVWFSRKTNSSVFSYYWDCYHDLFRRSPSILESKKNQPRKGGPPAKSHTRDSV